MQVTICTANCVGQAGNCSYPNKVTVVTGAAAGSGEEGPCLRRVQRELSKH